MLQEVCEADVFGDIS